MNGLPVFGKPVKITAAGPADVFSTDQGSGIIGFVLVAGSDAATATIQYDDGDDFTVLKAAANTQESIWVPFPGTWEFPDNINVTLTGTSPTLYIYPSRSQAAP